MIHGLSERLPNTLDKRTREIGRVSQLENRTVPKRIPPIATAARIGYFRKTEVTEMIADQHDFPRRRRHRRAQPR